MINSSLRTQAWMLAGLLLAAGNAATSEMPVAQTYAEFERMGYVSMDLINTPMLYPASTGKPYNARVMLLEGRSSVPAELRQALNEIDGRDEFRVHSALQQLEPFLLDRRAGVKNARGYLVPVQFTLGEYDFQRRRFPLKLGMKISKPKSPDSFHCVGAYDKVRNVPLTACVSAVNWNDRNPAFQFLAIDSEEQARGIKQQLRDKSAGFVFVMEPADKFRIVDNDKMRYGGIMDPVVISGIQPARVMGLLLIDFASGRVLLSGPLGDSRNAPPEPDRGAAARDRAPDVSAPPIAGDGVPPTKNDGNGDPAPVRPGDPARPPLSTPTVPGVTVGVPSAPETLRLDKLLSMLSYASYADPGKQAAAREAVEQLRAKLDRIESDTGRDQIIKIREVKKIGAALDAATLKMQEIDHQLAVKQTAINQFGLRPVARPALEREAKAGKLYFESYGMPDGHHVVVFRGTDNKDDLLTDLQLGLTPQLASELASRVKSAGGKAVISGLSDVAVKGVAAGHIDTANLGKPQPFIVADDLVRKIIASGIRAERLILTGHSLGGGYAQYAGLRHRVGVVVAFNPAPLSARLQQDAGPAGATSQLRHYVSFIAVAGQNGGGFFDPVSQLTKEYLRMPDISALRVIGEQFAVPVCASMQTPEYVAFAGALQSQITHHTLKSLDHGGGRTKTVGKLVGQISGGVNASTEHSSAIEHGGAVGKIPGSVLATAAYCSRHPYMCAGKAVVGGVASAVTEHTLAPKAWHILNAHRMKNLQEAIALDGLGQCDEPIVAASAERP